MRCAAASLVASKSHHAQHTSSDTPVYGALSAPMDYCTHRIWSARRQTMRSKTADKVLRQLSTWRSCGMSGNPKMSAREWKSATFSKNRVFLEFFSGHGGGVTQSIFRNFRTWRFFLFLWFFARPSRFWENCAQTWHLDMPTCACLFARHSRVCL